jgi:hypothetical protein
MGSRFRLKCETEALCDRRMSEESYAQFEAMLDRAMKGSGDSQPKSLLKGKNTVRSTLYLWWPSCEAGLSRVDMSVSCHEPCHAASSQDGSPTAFELSESVALLQLFMSMPMPAFAS